MNSFLLSAAASSTTPNEYYTDLKRFITHICEEVMKITNALDISGIPPRPLNQSENDTQSNAELDNNDVPMAIADKVSAPNTSKTFAHKTFCLFKTIEIKTITTASAGILCKLDDNHNVIVDESACEKCKKREIVRKHRSM